MIELTAREKFVIRVLIIIAGIACGKPQYHGLPDDVKDAILGLLKQEEKR